MFGRITIPGLKLYYRAVVILKKKKKGGGGIGTENIIEDPGLNPHT
jgi:hypothetical protein